MEDWVKKCLKRRQEGDKVDVSGPKGEVYQIGGQEFNRRHFFGLCPGCLKIGEHSACSGSDRYGQEGRILKHLQH